MYLVLVLLCPVVSSAWQEEILKGSYSYESKNLAINFVWGDDGIEQLRINGRPYSKAKYDNLGVFGSSALIEIRAEEKPTSLKVIQLLFFVDGKKPIVVSGHYVDMRNIRDDGTFATAVARAIVMSYRPVEAKTPTRVARP